MIVNCIVHNMFRQISRIGGLLHISIIANATIGENIIPMIIYSRIVLWLQIHLNFV